MIVDPVDVLTDFVGCQGIRQHLVSLLRDHELVNHGPAMLFVPGWFHGAVKAIYSGMPEYADRKEVLLFGCLVLDSKELPDLFDRETIIDYSRFYARPLPEPWTEWVATGCKTYRPALMTKEPKAE